MPQCEYGAHDRPKGPSRWSRTQGGGGKLVRDTLSVSRSKRKRDKAQEEEKKEEEGDEEEGYKHRGEAYKKQSRRPPGVLTCVQSSAQLGLTEYQAVQNEEGANLDGDISTKSNRCLVQVYSDRVFRNDGQNMYRRHCI